MWQLVFGLLLSLLFALYLHITSVLMTFPSSLFHYICNTMHQKLYFLHFFKARMRRSLPPRSSHSPVPSVTFCRLTWCLRSASFLVVTIPLAIAQSFSRASSFLKWYWDLFYSNLRRVLTGCQKLYCKPALSELYYDQRQSIQI